MTDDEYPTVTPDSPWWEIQGFRESSGSWSAVFFYVNDPGKDTLRQIILDESMDKFGYDDYRIVPPKKKHTINSNVRGMALDFQRSRSPVTAADRAAVAKVGAQSVARGRTRRTN